MMGMPDFTKKQILAYIPKEGDKLSYSNDNIVIKDADGKIKYQCTCYQLFSIIIIGNVSVTSGVIMRANRFKYSVCMMTDSLKTYHIMANGLEGNTLLRDKQYHYNKTEIAQHLIHNKIVNQRDVLKRIRKKTPAIKEAIAKLNEYGEILDRYNIDNLHELMGIEGVASRVYFPQVFSNVDWKGRKPRTKCDYVNTCLDIGYTVLFNFVECLLQLYGFDVFCGVLHRNFYMRKSLVCDIMEPFRPIIDWKVRTAINLEQIQQKDFDNYNNQIVLKKNKNSEYVSLFVREVLREKEDIFLYIQTYYRAFMKQKNIEEYPMYDIYDIG